MAPFCVFSDIIGHKDIIRALTAAIATGRVGHAYLFLGPAGIGKKTLALAFATRLLCRGEAPGPDCGCPSCSRLRSGNHPDFTVIEAEGNSIKIEQLRELQHQVFFHPLLGERKVFFFPEAEQLTEAAANSFLKTLEEPPAGVHFLFTAVRPEYILPTIRSRCQTYQLFPVPAPEIAGWLMGKGYSAEAAEARSGVAEGIPGRALTVDGATLSAAKYGRIGELLDQDLLQLLKIANEFEKKERKEVLAILRNWEAQLREELLDLEAKPAAAPPQHIVMVARLEKLGQTIRWIESNVNLRLAVENFFIAVKTAGNPDHRLRRELV
ncbi:DNA polymerase-3 subunit delta' [Hydrogenispora ethanolica]|jgi:DNA polymerase-3 subunit delta'|uniref:DNA polymerase-3 subunit delta n=1 Tax=Hydrogenispora ethanolica TaxID=1082276 RepID=A0A4R1QX22_HYDET|nr:DNA polymerase III subunit delta' [Hydrogenispora ethanolica]TCL55150.1 DNA polymerase-3 subunit delta' [Hydrogenispora ethanolica]